MIKHAQQVAIADDAPLRVVDGRSHREEHIAPAPRVSVQAFCESVETPPPFSRRAKIAVSARPMSKSKWAAPPPRSRPPVLATPNVILIEPEARGDDILHKLDQLAEVCDAGTRVVVVGRIN